MLVTFSCKVSGNVVMFGDVAKQMLRMMGQCENIPGAIDAEHISVALSNLQQAAGRIHQLELDSREHGELQEREVDACDEQDVEPVIRPEYTCLASYRYAESGRKRAVLHHVGVTAFTAIS